MSCDFRAPPNDEISFRLAAIKAARPALERRLGRALLDYYRARRRLPNTPARTLVSERALARIVARGEIEHRLRIARLIACLRAFSKRLAHRRAPERHRTRSRFSKN